MNLLENDKSKFNIKLIYEVNSSNDKWLIWKRNIDIYGKCLWNYIGFRDTDLENEYYLSRQNIATMLSSDVKNPLHKSSIFNSDKIRKLTLTEYISLSWLLKHDRYIYNKKKDMFIKK